MRVLCVGTYAKCIQKSLVEDGNEQVVNLLLDLVLDNVDIMNRNGDPYVVTPKIVNGLLSHKADVYKKIRDASATPTIIGAAQYYFEDVVIPGIMPDMVENLLDGMRQLILSDDTIPERTRSEFLSLCDAATLAQFLSGVFLYVLKQDNRIDTSSLNMEAASEIVPTLPAIKGTSSIPETDLYFLLEVDGTCPKCGKPLVSLKGGHGIGGYVITEIVPTAPTVSEREALGELLNGASSLNRSENSVALCPSCSNTYSHSTTYEECENLRVIKEKLRRSFDASTMLDKMYLEEQIEAVLRKIPLDSSADITETLEYTALRVREKILSNVPLIIKTEGFVVQYYRFIKSVFSQMEREGTIDFDGVASDVKRSYRKLATAGYTEEEVFGHLVDWFMKKASTRNTLACEIIVAFFVQNCEVFHAISE